MGSDQVSLQLSRVFQDRTTTVGEIHTELTAAKAVLVSLKSVYEHLITLLFSWPYSIPQYPPKEVGLNVHASQSWFIHLITTFFDISVEDTRLYHWKDQTHFIAIISLSGNLQKYHYTKNKLLDQLIKSDFLRKSRIGRHSRKIDFSFISPKHTVNLFKDT